MTGKRLSEIRELLRTYRPTDDPDRQGELLTAAQDLFDPARRGMRLESRLRRLLADWDRDVAARRIDPETWLDDVKLGYASSRSACADMLRAVLDASGVSVDA